MIVEYFDTQFLKTKDSGLDGKTKVRFTENSGKDNAFTVLCDREGMNFSGTLSTSIYGEDNIQDFARMIGEAWQEHRRLRVKVKPNGIIE